MEWAKINNVLLLLATALLAFAIGRWTAKEPDVAESIVEEVVEVETDREEMVNVEESSSRVEKEEETATSHTRITIEKPDGTKVTVEKTERGERARETTEEKETKTEQIVVEKLRIEYVDREVVKEVVSQKNPDWRIGVGVGVTSFNFAKPVYRFEVDRRILGPFYIGGRVGTDGSLTAVVSVTW